MPIEKLEKQVNELRDILDYNYNHYHNLTQIEQKKIHEFLDE